MLVYIDSSIWITYVEGLPAYQNNVEKHLEKLKKDGCRFCMSQAVILETLSKPYRKNNQALVSVYTELFQNSKILPNYLNLFSDCMEIMRTETLKAMDSIHIAFAVHYDCELFVTTDLDFRNVKSISIRWIELSL